MSEKWQNNPGVSSSDDRPDLIRLTDEDGNEISFELLDLIDYSGTQYAVLIPADDENADQVQIFRVDDAEKETNVLTPVTDMDLAGAIFELFKNRNADRFDFE